MEITISDRRVPPCYDENIFVFLVQGPGVAYVYWELSSSFQALLNKRGRPLLYIYEASENEETGAGPFDEVVLPPFTRNWYFKRLVPGRSYFCELGFRDEKNIFVTILRSNNITTPPSGQERGGEKKRLHVDVKQKEPVQDKDKDEGEDLYLLPTSTFFWGS